MPPHIYLTLLLGSLWNVGPWFVAGTFGVMLFSRSALGKALIRRLHEPSGGGEAFVALRADVEDLRREVGELQERLDFAERLAVQQRVALSPPDSAPPEQPSPPDPVSASHR